MPPRPGHHVDDFGSLSIVVDDSTCSQQNMPLPTLHADTVWSLLDRSKLAGSGAPTAPHSLPTKLAHPTETNAKSTC